LPGDPEKRRVGEWLLAPHLSYLKPLGPLLGHPGLKALAHVTGGGLTDNVPRVLPAGLAAEIRFGSWEIPHPFRLLQEEGDVELEEMFRVFNMGIGMVAIVDRAHLGELSKAFAAAGQRALPIGRVVEGRGVVYDLGLTEPDAPDAGA
jgi:phosphoribosylformylglycinamidine cyclo-ligase